MTLIWLLVWCVNGVGNSDGFPVLEQWNSWAIWLMIAVALDLADHR